MQTVNVRIFKRFQRMESFLVLVMKLDPDTGGKPAPDFETCRVWSPQEGEYDVSEQWVKLHLREILKDDLAPIYSSLATLPPAIDARDVDKLVKAFMARHPNCCVGITFGRWASEKPIGDKGIYLSEPRSWVDELHLIEGDDSGQ